MARRVVLTFGASLGAATLWGCQLLLSFSDGASGSVAADAAASDSGVDGAVDAPVNDPFVSHDGSAAWVAVSPSSIYWLSIKGAAIKRVSKTSRAENTVVTRPGQTVSDLIASSGDDLFWIETGPDEDARTSCRIMGLFHGASTPSVLYSPTKSTDLKHLSFGKKELFAVSLNQFVRVDLGPPLSSSAGEIGLTTDGLGNYGSDVFYTYLSATPGRNEIVALGNPNRLLVNELYVARELAVDDTRVYFVQGTPDASTSRISAVDRNANGVSGDSVPTLASGEQNPIALAIYRPGLNASEIVWANAETGAIRELVLGADGGAETVATARQPNRVATDDDGIYWSSSDGVTWLPRPGR